MVNFDYFTPLAIDFEYNKTSEGRLGVICCALAGPETPLVSFDLRKDKEGFEGRFTSFKEILDKYKKDRRDSKGRPFVLVSHSVEAEAGALLSLGIDPRGFYFIDTLIEFKAIANSNPRFHRFISVSKDGWELGKQGRVSASLSSMIKILLRVDIDTQEKDEVRNLIIEGNKEKIDSQMGRILNYCESDIKHLLPCLVEIEREAVYRRYVTDREIYFKKMTLRGAFSCVSGVIARRGYPVDVEKVAAFRENVPRIISELKLDVNRRISRELGFDLFNKQTLKLESKLFREYLSKNFKGWPLTQSGIAKLDEDTLKKYTHSKHTYKDTPIDQYLRFLRTESSLKGFMERPGKKSFFDTLGEDGRSRPYQNIFGSQTGRSQPSSTGFIFLKSAWLRGLVHPPRGRIIIGLDYVSQEFLIAAHASKDRNMVTSYASGDPYLAFAKLSGQAPPDATRASHGDIRDLCKSSVLGIMFGMGAASLAAKISQDTGRKYTQEEAQRQINLFKKSYSKKVFFDSQNIVRYDHIGFLELPDGWPLFGANKNPRSVVNFPVQGRGASVMRRAVLWCDARGLSVIFTLHDAVYIECGIDEIEEKTLELARCMRRAYREIMHDGLPDDLKCDVRLDGKAWGDGLGEKSLKIKLEENYTIDLSTQDFYLDKRGADEYQRFKKYLEKNV